MSAVLKKSLLGVALALSASVTLAAPAVLSTGTISIGLFDDGGLGGAGVGVQSTFLPAGGNDAITPGCLCEGWGAAANGTAGYTYGGSNSGFTTSALTVTTASGVGLSAQSVVTLANGLQVTHTYSYAAGGLLFRVNIALTNTTAGTLADVRYARTLDWDVPPGHFSDDFTTIYGGTPSGPGGKVLHTSTDPFDVPNPLVTRTTDANQNVVNRPGDLGSYFIFGFGSLLAGETETFDTYIGAASTTAGLLAAMGSVGVEAYSYTFDNDTPVTYGYGFVGLDLPPSLGVPEPGALALVAIALLAAGAARRRV